MPEDKLYIEKVLNGDTRQYSFLVDKYQNMAFTLAFRISGNREDAEEIAQDSFVKAYQALNRFKIDAKFSTWLYRIVYNTSISYLRKRKGVTVEFDENIGGLSSNENTINSLNEISQKAQNKYIKLAINKLLPQEALILTLYYYDDCSIKEISEITGLAASNIKVKLHRLRKKLYGSLYQLLNEEVRDLI